MNSGDSWGSRDSRGSIRVDRLLHRRPHRNLYSEYKIKENPLNELKFRGFFGIIQ